MPEAPDPDYDPNSATLPLSGPRPTLSGSNVDLPLPEELAKLLPAGAYEITGFLGAGGMGAVYKGMQVRLKRPVAIKIMRRDLGKDHDFEARFEREAQAMAKLNHPNIVSVIDYGEAGPDYLYIVMELVDGADLMDVIRGGQMTQEMALSLLPQICDALQFAHDHGIVHRDIKPSNIMLTRDGRIKMADFGLAKRFDVESSFRTQTGAGMGTPDYAAPEQFSPNSPIDHRADIYALGVMIYQMITGHLPRGVWKPPSQRAKVSTQWDAVVSRAMQSDPSDRYQQASEVKTDVSSIPLASAGRAAGPSAAASSPTAAKSPDTALAGTSAPPLSRTPLLFGLVVGAVVIAIGALFVLKKPDQTSPPTASTSAISPSSPVAEPWVRVWNSPEGLSNAVTLVDGWVVSKVGGTTRGGTLLYPMQWHDSAIRSEWKWAGGPSSGSIGGHISIRESGKHRYKLSRNKKALRLERTSDDNVTVLLQEYSVGEPEEGETFTLELRAVGTTLTARLDGKEVIRVEDDKLTAGGPAVYVFEKGGMRNIEVLNLDQPAVASSIQWQKANWTEEDLKKKTIMADGGWARIGEKAGAANGWPIAAGGQNVTFKDGVVRLRYRWQGETILLKTRNEKTFGQILLWGPHVELGFYLNSTETRLFQKVTFPEPLKVGDEGTLEIAAIGNRLYARLNDSIVLSSPEIPELVPSGFCAIQSVSASFRDVEYAILDDLPEAEALRLLGVDEQGNDLRGKAGAVSTSPSLPDSSSPSSATKAAPFINSLGMKFVPVPGTQVLFSIWPTRVQDYEVFVKEAKREWGKAPFEQGPTHPVVGPNWDDAQAFGDWLTETERKAGKLGANERYRLPSDHEWSCAVDLGDKEDASQQPAEKHLKIADVFPWGKQWPPPKGAGNFAGEEMQPALAAGLFSNIKGEMLGYHDGFVNTSPVGSFAANRFGLHDMGGNVWQWCADWVDGSQKARVLRGSSSQDRDRILLQSSFRNRYQPQAHMINHGFRVVLAPAAH